MSKIAYTYDLTAFKTYVKNVNNSADQSVQIDRYGNVGKATNTASAVSRFFAFTDNAQAAKMINLNVRTAFLDALKRQFNVKEYGNLPDYIKDALVGTHADTWDEDFNIKDGVVQSTKPLTVRRIRAVFAAIEAHAAKPTIIEANAAKPTALEEHVGEPVANFQKVINPILLETDPNKVVQIVKARMEKLAICFDELAEKLTNDIPDPVDKMFKHSSVYPKRNLGTAKYGLQRLISRFARVGVANPETGKRETLNYAKDWLRKILSGGLGLVLGYWNGGAETKTVVYRGKEMQNRAAFKQLVDDLVNDFVNDFNAKYPELALADE